MGEQPIVVIELWGERHSGECPMCEQEALLDRAVGWYEEAVTEDIGTILPHGGVVGGMSVCRACHDRHYRISAATNDAVVVGGANG